MKGRYYLAEINPSKKIPIENLNSWALNFQGKEMKQDIVIPPSVKNWRLLSFNEIDAQVKSGNRFFCGTDGRGSNAAIKILDEEARREVFGFVDEAMPEQGVLDMDTIKALLKTTPKAAFEKKLAEVVVTESEKKRLAMLAKDAGIENAEGYKISAIRALTGANLI